MTAGSPFTVKVTAEDANGNVATSFSGSVTLTVAGPSNSWLGGKSAIVVKAVRGVATFAGLKLALAGSNYSLTATTGTLTATTNAFPVAAGAATYLKITQQPLSSVSAGIAFGLVVTAFDAYNNVANTFSGKVTLTAISPGLSPLSGTTTMSPTNGVFTFTALMLDIPGGYVIQAKSGKLKGAQTNSFTVTS